MGASGALSQTPPQEEASRRDAGWEIQSSTCSQDIFPCSQSSPQLWIFAVVWHFSPLYAPRFCFYFPACALETDTDQWERACDTLLMCIVTVLNHGLRNGGGVGDILRKPSKDVSSGSTGDPFSAESCCVYCCAAASLPGNCEASSSVPHYPPARSSSLPHHTLYSSSARGPCIKAAWLGW